MGEILQKTETINPLLLPDIEFEYVDVSSVSNVTFRIESTQRLLGKDAPSRARRLLRTNDILLATIRPTLQRIAVVPEAMNGQVCSTGYFVLRPIDSLDYRYLFYFLFSVGFSQAMEELQKGASYPAVTDAEVRSQLVPFPALSEQRRIIAILDEAFDGIAIAKANAEKNLKNARELFESYRQSLFSQPVKGWIKTTLDEIAVVESGGTPLVSNKNFWGGTIAWYSSGELNALRTISPGRHISQDGLNSSNAKVFPSGSLLIGMYDTAALKMSILDRDGAFNQAIAGVKPNEKIDTIFLLHAINAIKPFLLSLRRGVRQKNLSLAKIKEIELHVPSLREQRTIVTLLGDYLSQTQRLESLYQQKITALDELKKSLLQKAFSGEL